jgi:hypothetical protein
VVIEVGYVSRYKETLKMNQHETEQNTCHNKCQEFKPKSAIKPTICILVALKFFTVKKFVYNL